MRKRVRAFRILPLIYAPLLISLATLPVITGCDQAAPPFVCADSLGCVTVPPGKPIKIGVLQALSGKVAPLGQAQIRGLELALEHKGNELLNHPVILQTEDTGCSPEGGANAALKIIADPETVAIYGTTCSSDAATVSQVMSDAGLVMISGNNSAPMLTSIAGQKAPHWHPGYFRTAPNEENAGQAAALFAFNTLGLRRAATIHDNDIYTMGLVSGFTKAFEELGGELVLAASINKGDTDMAPVVTAVAKSQAELLFFPLFQPEGNYLLQQARKSVDLNKKIVLMSDGALIEGSFISAMGDDARGMYFVGPVSPAGVAVERMVTAYEKKYQEKPTVSYYLSGYDGANLLFHALEQASIRGQDGTLHVGRQKLRDTLYGIQGFNGVTGNLRCDQFGDCAPPAFNVLQMHDPAQGVAGLEANVKFTYRPDTAGPR